MDPLVSSYLLFPPPFPPLIFFLISCSSLLTSPFLPLILPWCFLCPCVSWFPFLLFFLFSPCFQPICFTSSGSRFLHLSPPFLHSCLALLFSAFFSSDVSLFPLLFSSLVGPHLLFSFCQLLSPLFSCHLILPLVLSFPLLISPPPFITSWILSFFLLFSSRLLFPLILLIHPLSSSYTYISFFSPLFIHFSLFLFSISSLMSLLFCSSLLLFLLLIFHITTSSLSPSSLILTTIEWTSSPTFSFSLLSTLPFTYIIFIFGPFFFIYILPFVVFLIITPPDIFKLFLYFSIFFLFSPQHVVFSVF